MSRVNYWEAYKVAIGEKITELWHHPELPLMEYESSEILCKWLEDNEFNVERGLCGMPTSFRATYGSGKPVIGILSEYDGMDGLSNDAVPYRKALSSRAGHACLHCHIGGANTGAAIAVKDFLKDTKTQGTVVVIGCPGEEVLFGKVALLGEGGFDGLDILLTCHVDYQNAAVSQPTLSAFMTEFCFGGISSHTGAARAHNALDGVELTVQTVERMRAHQFPKTSVEHVVRNGGAMPNITPNRASVWFCVRDADYDKAKQVYEYIREAAVKSAEIAGVKIAEGFLAGTRGYLPNDVIGDLMWKNINDIGPVTYTEAELDEFSELAKNAIGAEKVTSNPELIYLKGGIDPYSQDDGEASWHIPLGRLNWELPWPLPLHNWCTTAAAGFKSTQKGALMCSETIYRTALDLLNDPSLVEKAETERKERIDDCEIGKPLYDNYETLTKNPEAFWDGTWLNTKV